MHAHSLCSDVKLRMLVYPLQNTVHMHVIESVLRMYAPFFCDYSINTPRKCRIVYFTAGRIFQQACSRKHFAS